MNMPVEHHEIGAVVIADDAAALGEVAHHQLLVAFVVHEKTEQVAGRRAVADMEGQAWLGTGKSARLKDLRDHVGADLGDQGA